MLEQVKDAVVTVQQLPPAPSDDGMETLRWVIGGLSFLFLSLLGGVHAHTKKVENDVDDRIARAVKASEDRMAGSVFANAERIAHEVRAFNVAKDELWRKIDDFMNHRVDDARNLPTREDLTALETRMEARLEAARQDTRKDRKDMEDRLTHSIDGVRDSLTDLIMRKQ